MRHLQSQTKDIVEVLRRERPVSTLTFDLYGSREPFIAHQTEKWCHIVDYESLVLDTVSRPSQVIFYGFVQRLSSALER